MQRIIIVEDEEKIRRFIKEILEMEGYIVDEAIDGKEGLKKILLSDYDLVISDIKMPFLHGDELFKKAVDEKPFMKKRFVFMTADTGNPDVMNFFEENCCRYLEKPFNVRLLLNEIKAVCNGGLYRR